MQFSTDTREADKTILRAGAAKAVSPLSFCPICITILLPWCSVSRCNRLIKSFLDDKALRAPSADCHLGEASDKGFKFATVCLFPAAEACRGEMQEGRAVRKALSGPRSASVREEMKIVENTIGESFSF